MPRKKVMPKPRKINKRELAELQRLMAARKSKKDYLFIFAITFLILVLLFSIYYPLTKLPIEYREVEPKFFSKDNATLVSAYLPAVDANGEGVMTTLSVEAMPGDGRVLLDIEHLLFWADTEHSIRVARKVAENITGLDINKFDLIYSVQAEAVAIGGESAGAALTIATIAALQNKKFKERVVITGSINHDGSIGPVAGILEKARASKENNASLFLVPLLQSRDIVYETKKYCEDYGFTEICTLEQIPKKINVGEQAGIEVREVETIRGALPFFISEDTKTIEEFEEEIAKI